MDWYRLRHTIGLCLRPSAMKRAEYLKKHHVFHNVGDNCMVMFRKVPLYPELISFGNNVWIASDVLFVTHDVIHHMLNYKLSAAEFPENVGCIDIKDNVFIGSNTTILPDVQIGPDTVVAAGSVVNRSLPGNGVYGGVPAKYICSLDDLMNKRRAEPKISLDHSGSGLSEAAARAVWNRFNSKEK
ncbi:MAG: acyltransferase [Firmicutes bacterium]|nr:acyltransferase [Bacillota bacterium]